MVREGPALTLAAVLPCATEEGSALGRGFESVLGACVVIGPEWMQLFPCNVSIMATAARQTNGQEGARFRCNLGMLVLQ